MLGLVPFMLLSFSYGCGEVKLPFISRPADAMTLGATTPAAAWCRQTKEIGGDSAEGIQGGDCDVPLRSASLESLKATLCTASSEGYHFRSRMGYNW
jgi:hypothetical protein